MKIFQCTALVALAALTGIATTQKAFAENLRLPPLKIVAPAAHAVPAGDWAAAGGTLDFSETRNKALQAENAGKIAEALTLWERVIDRTKCFAENRAEARRHIRVLRPKVAPANTSPEKAKKWKVLALIYNEVDIETTKLGEKVRYHRKMNQENLQTIAKELAGWRDLVFEYSSGLLLLDIDAVVVEEPLKKLSTYGKGYIADEPDVKPAAEKEMKKQHYDTVISYIKHRNGDGPDLPRPRWVAATVAKARAMQGAGHIMIPWGDDYPFVGRGEFWGEMELHEWLHQMDYVIQDGKGFLRYPRGVAQNPDRGGNNGEYVRAKTEKNWCGFYRYIMDTHITRQVWTEVTTQPNKGQRPGDAIR
ncbi:MAG: hypothetical protein LBG65_00045 [Puniceicoccales bacterium]|jgi:hypothetical protein|nr:hypothetical protein [Puniceicoccales bacterium]